MAAARPEAGLVIRAAPAVVTALEGPVAEARQALEQRLGRPLELVETDSGAGEAAEVLAVS